MSFPITDKTSPILKEALSFARALDHSDRTIMLSLIFNHEGCTTKYISEKLNYIKMPNISMHLGILLAANVVSRQKSPADARVTRYFINHEVLSNGLDALMHFEKTGE